jgi:translation initiation factor 3 subunit K
MDIKLMWNRYQFNPHLSNPEIIVNILLKSLSATVQGPDFNLCLSMLREPAVSIAYGR